MTAARVLFWMQPEMAHHRAVDFGDEAHALFANAFEPLPPFLVRRIRMLQRVEVHRGVRDDVPDRVDVVHLAVPDGDIGHDRVESKVSVGGCCCEYATTHRAYPISRE